MAAFKEMDPDEVRKLLEGHKDILTPAVQAEQAHFQRSSCPNCGGGACSQVLNTSRPFSQGALLPNKLLVCQQCRTEFDPYTGIVIRSATGQVDPFSGR